MSRTAYRYLENRGFTCVLWNSVPGDWRNPHGWVPDAVAAVEGLTWPLVVLHDLPTGAMEHLEEFILKVQDLGAEFTDTFPADCVPLLRGRAQWDMSNLMTAR